MGLQSHSRRARLIKVIIAPPVAPGKRRCQGEIYERARHHHVVVGRDERGHRVWQKQWIEEHVRPCLNPCSTFVTEINYCAQHMPTDWVVLANARVELWNQLSVEAWEHVLDTYPGIDP